jgi:hypothetical protein
VKLEWHRPGVVQVTAKVEELALLVAGARLAAAALEDQDGEQAAALSHLLASLDRAVAGLHRRAVAARSG